MEIIIVGSAVSLLVQALKSKFGGGWQTLALLLVLSVASAGVYVALVEVGAWETIAQILLVAGAFYTFVIQRFEK